MQDFACFNIYKRQQKKGRKYKEWKVDLIRDDDRDHFSFLEKQLMRMRKKEELVVGRKQVTKRNTFGYMGSQERPPTSGVNPPPKIRQRGIMKIQK